MVTCFLSPPSPSPSPSPWLCLSLPLFIDSTLLPVTLFTFTTVDDHARFPGPIGPNLATLVDAPVLPTPTYREQLASRLYFKDVGEKLFHKEGPLCGWLYWGWVNGLLL